MTRILDNAVIALGYFDSVHIGHREVIKSAKLLAEKLNSKLVVFTFLGNLRAVFNGEREKCVYSPKERENLLKRIGADEVFFAPTSQEFLSLSREEFLEKINSQYNIKGYVSGKDYRFGKLAKGDVCFLQEYAKSKGQTVETVEDVNLNGIKVSTSYVKELLTSGEIEKANALLGERFFITGKVIKDRGVGRKMGFPTANVKVDNLKQTVKDGVYSGAVMVDGNEYKAVINVGNRPTFSVKESVVEAHLLSFAGDMYGKEITVKFSKRIRDVIKFSSEEQLKEQIEKDKIKVEKDD